MFWYHCFLYALEDRDIQHYNLLESLGTLEHNRTQSKLKNNCSDAACDKFTLIFHISRFDLDWLC